MDKIQNILEGLSKLSNKTDKRLCWINKKREGAINEERFNDIIELYKTTDLNMIECCTHFNVHIDSYQHHRRTFHPEFNLKRNKKWKNLFEEKEDTPAKVEDIRNGMYSTDWCEKWGLHKSTYVYFAKRHGIKTSRKPTPPTANKEEKLQDILNGMSRSVWMKKWEYKGGGTYFRLKKKHLGPL
jgi:hypothetical protein